ncbi:uracil-DNA glycosylase [Burkholderia ubonensis]|uniref:uracil-DNA glycosylase n=1 Tax=Burkholderia ubonensis TaxID=101571 RepID=UPI000AC1B4ED|nr:uracil-DNA glycosylase [Burkholderia ubonensis]
MEYPDTPRAFAQRRIVELRRLMLSEPHVAPLTAYVEELRAKHPKWEFQDFDPLDGGIDADILFLLEKPGPMTSPTGKRQGSGFISRDNDDPTAEALFKFMQQAGIDRKRTVLWNVVPGWDGTRKLNSVQVRDGVTELANLMVLLPRVKTVVLVGGKAARAEKFMASMNLRIFRSAHPSPLVYARYPEIWRDIWNRWAEAGRTIPKL